MLSDVCFRHGVLTACRLQRLQAANASSNRQMDMVYPLAVVAAVLSVAVVVAQLAVAVVAVAAAAVAAARLVHYHHLDRHRPADPLVARQVKLVLVCE